MYFHSASLYTTVMSNTTPQQTTLNTSTPGATEVFLATVDSKTTDPVHKRLLRAARGNNPLSSLESELRAIVTEIIHANK